MRIGLTPDMALPFWLARRVGPHAARRIILQDQPVASDRALKLVREALDTNPEFTQRVELRLVEAGSRDEQGQIQLADTKAESADWTNWGGRLEGFVSETERFFGLLEGVMPEIAWAAPCCGAAGGGWS